jgi:hypothetical protein
VLLSLGGRSLEEGKLTGRHDIDRLPVEFWKILHAEYGIVVYPSALLEEIDVHGVGLDRTFTDTYEGHIGNATPSRDKLVIRRSLC